jgi:putative Holliday junction resolvase
MKYLGIDYGKKRIGLAISDSQALVAMPLGIFENNEDFIENLKKIIKKENIEEVVLGESINLNGNKNLIQKDISIFADKLENFGLKVKFVNEVFSSMASK